MVVPYGEVIHDALKQRRRTHKIHRREAEPLYAVRTIFEITAAARHTMARYDQGEVRGQCHGSIPLSTHFCIGGSDSVAGCANALKV